MKELIEYVARALVDSPDDVLVDVVEDAQGTVVELRVGPNDLGKVIGRAGRTARAMRQLLAASSSRLKRRVTLEILE